MYQTLRSQTQTTTRSPTSRSPLQSVTVAGTGAGAPPSVSPSFYGRNSATAAAAVTQMVQDHSMHNSAMISAQSSGHGPVNHTPPSRFTALARSPHPRTPRQRAVASSRSAAMRMSTSPASGPVSHRNSMEQHSARSSATAPAGSSDRHMLDMSFSSSSSTTSRRSNSSASPANSVSASPSLFQRSPRYRNYTPSTPRRQVLTNRTRSTPAAAGATTATASSSNRQVSGASSSQRSRGSSNSWSRARTHNASASPAAAASPMRRSYSMNASSTPLLQRLAQQSPRQGRASRRA
jgi:hypothetical protein